jgi:tripartite-type tricarboxylate transporter receptor subunit TctC
MAPSGTPKAAIARLNTDIARALDQASVKEKLLTQGLIAAPSAPDQFALHIKQDFEQLVTVIKATGIKPN